MAVVRDLAGRSHRIIAVIGDGSLSAGMAYEALNNAGAAKSRLIVILNDNEMSIAPPVGAMSAYLEPPYQNARTAGAPPGDSRSEQRLDGAARSGDAATALRGNGIPLHRARRRARLRPASAGPGEGLATATRRPRSRPRRHPEGKGLRPGGGVQRQVPQRREVRHRDRSPGQGQGRARRPTPRSSARPS